MAQMNDFQLFIKVNKLKQKQVAEYLGTSTQYVNQVANGKCALSGDKYELLAQSQWDVSMLEFPAYLKVPAATMTPIGEQWVDGTLPKAQPSATPTEAMRDGVNVITDAESVDLSVLPVEVVEEIKAEVAEEIKREESIIIVSPEVANTPGTNIKKYIKDKGDELERMYLGDLLPDGVNIAERVRKTSMLPSFQPGDWIFVKFINKDNITDGETYYFDFNTRPTMIRKVKFEGDDLRLIAKNHQFGDIIIKRDEINNIGDIVGMFRGYFGDQYDDIEALRRKKDAQTDELIKCNGDLIKQNGDALKIVERLVSVIEKKQ